MTRVKPHPCAICGTLTLNPIYCSDACKMKAYRKRKKQKRESEKLMLPMDFFVIQERLVERYGIDMHNRLYSFVHSFGKEAYIASLETLAIVLSTEVEL